MKKLLIGLAAVTGFALSSKAGALQWTFAEENLMGSGVYGTMAEEPFVLSGIYFLVAWPGDAATVANMLENWVDPVASGKAFGFIPPPLQGTPTVGNDENGFWLDGNYFINDPSETIIQTGERYTISVFNVLPLDVEKAEEIWGFNWMEIFELSETPWGAWQYATFELVAVSDPMAQKAPYINYDSFFVDYGWIYPIPEPATFSLLGLGAAVLGLRRRKRA